MSKEEHLERLRRLEAGREVFVRPLPAGATSEEVRDMVLDSCGRGVVAIDRVKLLPTAAGTLLSAFVTLSSAEEARLCTARLNGASFGGQLLAASLARDREKVVKEVCMFFLEGKCSRGLRKMS